MPFIHGSSLVVRVIVRGLTRRCAHYRYAPGDLGRPHRLWCEMGRHRGPHGAHNGAWGWTEWR